MKILNSYAPCFPVKGLKDMEERPTLLAVLVDGGAGKGDWACYVGIVNLPHLDDDSRDYYKAERKAAEYWVAGHGLKQSLEEAQRFLPILRDRHYRA